MLITVAKWYYYVYILYVFMTIQIYTLAYLLYYIH